MDHTLIAFVKEPRPGTVKTRLARHVGDEDAAELYRVLAEEELRRTAPVTGEYGRLLFFAPQTARAAVEAWLPGEVCLPQQGRDLGERMSNAFEEAFRSGARRVAIVGSDVPWCGRAHVREALTALEGHDLVLGPTTDGGYYLLAVSRPRPQLFTGIPWSTAEVLPRTLARAGALGLSVRLLEPLEDVDTLEDLRRTWPRCVPLLAGREALRAALERSLGRPG